MTPKAQAPEYSNVFLTPKALADRWNNVVTIGTLANWRCQRRGPKAFKPGGHKKGAVLYRLADVIEYEKKMTVETKGR